MNHAMKLSPEIKALLREKNVVDIENKPLHKIEMCVKEQAQQQLISYLRLALFKIHEGQNCCMAATPNDLQDMLTYLHK